MTQRMQEADNTRHQPLVAWYGDDFTGATDTLATLALAGLRSVLFLGVPTPKRIAAAGTLDAIGIAGAARSMTPAQMEEELKPVGHFFAQTGARVIHYKCCSTFDSAPTVGSIGVAVKVLRQYVAHPLVPIIGGQPNLGRYCSFANLYAKVGQGAPVYRIDCHPVMQSHPVTPMKEADLRVHLGQQGLQNIASLVHTAYDEEDDPEGVLLRHKANAAVDAGAEAVLLDVVGERDLFKAGQLMWTAAQEHQLLAVGASSVQQALIRYWENADTVACDMSAKAAPHQLLPTIQRRSGTAILPAATTPVLMFAGSMSPVTTQQIEACTRYQKHVIDIDLFQQDAVYFEGKIDAVVRELCAGHHVLVYSERTMQEISAQTLAMRSAQFVHAVIQDMASQGRRLARVGIAGGDTSSHVTQALGLWGLAFLHLLAPGVAMSRAYSDDAAINGLEIMLKGGQMGSTSLFDDLVTGN